MVFTVLKQDLCHDLFALTNFKRKKSDKENMCEIELTVLL